MHSGGAFGEESIRVEMSASWKVDRRRALDGGFWHRIRVFPPDVSVAVVPHKIMRLACVDGVSIDK